MKEITPEQMQEELRLEMAHTTVVLAKEEKLPTLLAKGEKIDPEKAKRVEEFLKKKYGKKPPTMEEVRV